MPGVLIPVQVVVRQLRGHKASWKFACSDGGMSFMHHVICDRHTAFSKILNNVSFGSSERTERNEGDGRIRRGTN